jgi:predicted O-methyltransferase YrrM
MIHDQKLEYYLDQHCSDLDAMLDDLERETHLRTLSPQMLSGKVQGQFLKLLSTALKPKCILEIGTFTGYASLCLAAGLDDGGELHTIECKEEICYLPQKYFDLSIYRNHIHLHIGNAIDILPALSKKFDLVFIDADKENYLHYYKMIVPMMSKGGVILADNVLWYGKVMNEIKDNKTQALHEFNNFVTTDDRVDNVIIPLRDGIHFIKVK